MVVGNAARNRTVKLCLLLVMLDPQLPLDEEISREVAFKDTNIIKKIGAQNIIFKDEWT